MSEKLYEESKIELTPFVARHYDSILNRLSFGKYHRFIVKAISDMDIHEGDQILDLGCGTGKNAALMSDFIGSSGTITGVDLSADMQAQFLQKHQQDDRIEFSRQRIDVPFDLGKKFDKILLSFVIHGFPHEIREQILRNALQHLNAGGQLHILDFSEFDMASMPRHHRFIFKKVECVYAFDFIEKDWKAILNKFGFSEFREELYFRNYTRLLSATKKN